MGSLTLGQWVAVVCIGVGIAGILEGIREVHVERMKRRNPILMALRKGYDGPWKKR